MVSTIIIFKRCKFNVNLWTLCFVQKVPKSINPKPGSRSVKLTRTHGFNIIQKHIIQFILFEYIVYISYLISCDRQKQDNNVIAIKQFYLRGDLILLGSFVLT